MERSNQFIEFIKTSQPKTWALITQAANEGLIFIDEDNDALAPTNRLLLTYPGLHKALCCIINDYAESINQRSNHG